MVWRNQRDWQLEQEQNLLYVALTRSKSELFIVGECDWYKALTTDKEISTSTATQPENDDYFSLCRKAREALDEELGIM